MAAATEPAELQEVFAYVERFTPTDYKLDFVFKPFIPDYLPSLGSVDDQIKVPRPDGQPDFLGLTCTDEPALNQSDPALLALKLRHKLQADAARGQFAGGTLPLDQPLGWVDPLQQPQKLDGWMDAVALLHQGKASASTLALEVADLEALVQQWPADMAEHVRASSLPDPKQDVDLKTYARMVCNVVDIQSGANPCEGLHELFTLFLYFKADPAMQRRHFFGGVNHDDLE